MRSTLLIVLILCVSSAKIFCQIVDDNDENREETDEPTDTTRTTRVITFTTRTTVTTTRPNYCAELSPQCSCINSPAVVKCDNFDSFEELDFSRLDVNSYLRQRTFEIELIPNALLTLDSTLDLSEFAFDVNAKIILRNIDGFKLPDNPFLGLREDRNLFFYIYESNIRTTGLQCDWNSLPADFDAPGIFASFDYVFFGFNLDYDENICPLLFHKADISFLEAYYMGPDNYLQFTDIQNTPEGFNLESKIHSFKIAFAPGFIVNNKMLNKQVFETLSEFNLDNIELDRIEDDAFEHTQRLTRIFLTLTNIEEFIRKSNNEWMAVLNADVVVDYNDPASIEANKERSLIINVNNRNSGQNYSYPDEDLVHFKYFPHHRMVFYRMLTDMDIECTETMRFLTQNIYYYDPPSYLNTTSAYKCHIIEDLTTTTTRTTRVITFTTRTTVTTTRPNYCAELSPQCSCINSPAVVKCDNFDSFEELDFSRLDVNSYLRQRTFEIELIPNALLTLDSTLNLRDLAFDVNAKIILRNIDGFKLPDNPFLGLREDRNLFFYIYESNIRTTGLQCDWNSLPADFDAPGIFASFDYVFFGFNLDYDENICPLLFHKANISFLEAYYMTPDNYLEFTDIQNTPNGFSLDSHIHTFKLSFAPGFIVNNKMLNKQVFPTLSEFNLDNIELDRIEDDAFLYTQRLTRIFLTLTNIEEFIRKSNNEWMAVLNADVVVDYNDPASIEANKERSLIINVNNRNSGQNYSYPDEDLVHFKYFPHHRMVFYRMLTDLDIECTDTMYFLTQNIYYYDPPSYLNTTSAYKCHILDDSSTRTTRTFTTRTTTTSLAPQSSPVTSGSLATSSPIVSSVASGSPTTGSSSSGSPAPGSTVIGSSASVSIVTGSGSSAPQTSGPVSSIGYSDTEHTDITDTTTTSTTADSTTKTQTQTPATTRSSTTEPTTTTQADSTVPLGTFLGVVIPLGVISLASTSVAAFFIYKTCFVKPKINPGGDIPLQ